MQVHVGDIVRNSWKGSYWHGLVVETCDDDILVWRNELSPRSPFLWVRASDLEVIGAGR